MGEKQEEVKGDMEQLKSGHNNIAIGRYALNGNTNGSYNIIIGNYSGTNITTQSGNFIFGDNIDAGEGDGQFIVGKDLPDLEILSEGDDQDYCMQAFLEHYLYLYGKIMNDYRDVFNKEQIQIILKKLEELHNKYKHLKKPWPPKGKGK